MPRTPDIDAVLMIDAEPDRRRCFQAGWVVWNTMSSSTRIT